MMPHFNPKQSNLVGVTKQLFRKSKVPVSGHSIENCIEDHPEYPSLLAMSDCLTTWKIPHQAYLINKAKFNSQQQQYPFIAHVSENGDLFVLVTQWNNNQIIYSNKKGRYQTVLIPASLLFKTYAA